MKRALLACFALCVLAGSAFAAEGAATWSFAVGEDGTCPRTVKATATKIEVDVSRLPKRVKVFRAVLRLERDRRPGWQSEADKTIILPAGGEGPLVLLPPRYASLDATAPVAEAGARGAGKVEFAVKSLAGWRRGTTRLDVSFTGPSARAKAKLPGATRLAARHRSGQTLVTWTQPAPTFGKVEKLTGGTWPAFVRKHAEAVKGLRYRIYRSRRAITAATIAQAELVDEVGSWTCWNTEFHGRGGRKDASVFTYVVEDGAQPVPPGTGIYAHNPAKGGKAYYAVSVARNGEEDFSLLGPGNALAEAVDEKVGPGEAILQRIEGPRTFFYTQGVRLHYYTRWEAPPRHNLPSRPYDYVVIIPAKLTKPAPLNLILHCWGSNLYGRGGAYSWHGWQDKRSGIGVASNQDPYDWWTTYHENLGTWRPWTEGVTRNFTPKRLLAFVDWMCTKWEVDRTRLCVSGESMGGAGSTFIPIRYGDRFSYAYSSVGIHNPGAIGGGFHESYARTNGRMKLDIQHESGMDAWDYLSDPLSVRKDPKANLPFIGFGNGRNDHGIGWAHAVDLKNALQEARQPHAVVWNLRGHGAGSFYPRIQFRTDQSLPAFTKCSLDDDMGTATRIKVPKKVKMPWGQTMTDVYDGDSEGGVNTHLRWATDDIVDEPGRWEMTVYLTLGKRGAPKDECTVNITPRRLQKFRIKPGEKFRWANTPLGGPASVKGGKEVQSGTVEADAYGLVTLEKVRISKATNRIRLVREK